MTSDMDDIVEGEQAADEEGDPEEADTIEESGEIGQPEEGMITMGKEAEPAEEERVEEEKSRRPLRARSPRGKVLQKKLGMISSDLADLKKAQENSQKSMEKQISALKKEIASVRQQFAKESKRSQEAERQMLSKIMGKLKTSSGRGGSRRTLKATSRGGRGRS